MLQAACLASAGAWSARVLAASAAMWRRQGRMNLVWMAALAVLTLLEKAAARGKTPGRCAGLALVGWGVALALGAGP